MLQGPFVPLINPELAPKETLYVTNLNDKIKVEDMKYALYFLFSSYGDVLKIIMKKNNRMRGQAFIIFQNLMGSTNAKAALNGMVIFDSSMQIEFARTRSNIFDQMDGNIYAKPPQEKKIPSKRELKAQKREQKAESQQQKIILEPDATSMLLAEDLPKIVTEEALEQLFGQYPGFKGVQYIAPRKLAFVEYENEEQASLALRGLSGFLLTTSCPLQLRYARKT